MNSTSCTFAPVQVGTSPAGVLWRAYRPEHVEPMAKRLAAVWERHNRKEDLKAVTVKLSATVLFFIEGMFTCDNKVTIDSTNEEDPIVFGATYLRTTLRAACQLESALREHEEDFIDKSTLNCETEAQYKFADAAARRSLAAAVRHFVIACG